MTKFTIAASVVTVLFVMQVPIESCSDEFVKQIIVNRCGTGTSKRSFGNPGPLFERSLKGGLLLGDIERVFRDQFGDIEEPDLQRKKPKDVETDGDRGGRPAIMKRELVDELKKCCYTKCTAKDFNGICDKK